MRLKRGWTEYELAKRSELTQSTISTWYRKGQIPTLQNIEKICNGFGITLSQFFAEGSDPVDLMPTQREMLDHWAALTPAQQQSVMLLLKSMCAGAPTIAEE